MSRFEIRTGVLVLAALLALTGCAGISNGGDGATQDVTSVEPSEVATDAAPSADEATQDGASADEAAPDGFSTDSEVRFRMSCYAATDGRPLGSFSSLDAVWASSNYLRAEYCDAQYVGTEPFTLTGTEAAIADIAVSGLENPGDPTEVYLEVLAACTRLGADAGPNSISGTPDPVLEATLSLCPEAPQANLIREQLGILG
jgi:hypothetical protein